jgi:hypothetical protein
MASLQELLKYLEQFMHGTLSQHGTPHPGAMPAGATAPHAPVAAGGMPAMPHPTMPPPGAAPPAHLADAPPAQVQEALSQFTAGHPELASYLSSAQGAGDLATLTAQLAALPPDALDAFVPAPQFAGDPASDGGLDLGGPLEAEFGDLPAFDGDLGGEFAGFADGLGGEPGQFSDLPSVLTDPSAGEFGPMPAAVVGDGLEADYGALAGALSGELEPDYADLVDGLTGGDFAADPVTAEFSEPVADLFDAAPTSFDEQPSPFDEPMHHGDIAAVPDEYFDQ